MGKRRGFGAIRRLPSGRYQASYTGPDTRRYRAPQTFETREDAEGWLADKRRQIIEDDWTPPTPPKRVLFRDFAADWMAGREPNLKPRTVHAYNGLLDRYLLPEFGDLPIRAITYEVVADWYDSQAKRPTARANAYGLLSSIMRAAASPRHKLVRENPCQIEGGAAIRRKSVSKPATLEELRVIVERMPDDRYKLMTLLAAWCALRYGELTELRRGDVDADQGIIRVRRAVGRVGGKFVVDTPKTAAGVRDIRIPPHLLPMLKDHLATVGRKSDALLFPAAHDPGKHMAPSALYKVFYPAREAAGRPDLRFHDLRHTGATLAAQTGATLAELMARLGHTTSTMALHYQHASADRDLAIAEKLSELANGES